MSTTRAILEKISSESKTCLESIYNGLRHFEYLIESAALKIASYYYAKDELAIPALKIALLFHNSNDVLAAIDSLQENRSSTGYKFMYFLMSSDSEIHRMISSTFFSPEAKSNLELLMSKEFGDMLMQWKEYIESTTNRSSMPHNKNSTTVIKSYIGETIAEIYSDPAVKTARPM